MLTRTNLLVLYIRLHCSIVLGHKTLTYSFHRPERWGEFTAENADCCPHLAYPSNDTSEDKFLPHFVGLGAMKAGSSALWEYLISNPDYGGSVVKETWFMVNDYKHNRSMRGYENVWNRDKTRGKVRFEITPCYIWIPFAACRFKKTLPNMKFAVIFRNPADRAYSEYNMVRMRCVGDDEYCIWRKLPFMDAVKKAIQGLYSTDCSFNKGDGKKTWNDCFRCLAQREDFRPQCHHRPFYFKMSPDKKACFDFEYHVVTHGLYAPQLSWWYSFYPPENFVVLLTDDFHKDPVKALNKIRDKVGMGREFEKEMLPGEGDKITFEGKYRYADTDKEETKRILTDFYARPNQELYQLLEETGQVPFTPFASSFEHASSNATQTNTLGVTNIFHNERISYPISMTNSVTMIVPPQTLAVWMFVMTALPTIVMLLRFTYNRRR